MTMKTILTLILMVFPLLFMLAQNPEQDAQQQSNEISLEEARELLAPANVRIPKALAMLMENRSLQDLTVDDLALVCRAYNELGDTELQYKASMVLWEKDKGSSEAVCWMMNSLHNKFMGSGDTTRITKFVDFCLKNNYGKRYDLLILKAKAVAKNENYEQDGKSRKESVKDIIVEAYKDKKIEQYDDARNLSLLDYLLKEELRDFFSAKEISDIKKQSTPI